MSGHNKLYSAALAAFAVTGIVVIVNGIVELSLGGEGIEGPFGTIPGWALPWLASIISIYVLASAGTLAARKFRPETGRRLTRAMNWALLPVVPFGTVIGLYGFLKVDRIPFEIEKAIADWRGKMIAASVKTPLPLDKLENDLRKETSEQMWSWSALDPAQAFEAAAERIARANGVDWPRMEEKKASIWRKDVLPQLDRCLQKIPADALTHGRGFGWAITGFLIPAFTTAFIFICDKVRMDLWDQMLVLTVVASCALFHYCVWRQWHEFLPVVPIRRARYAAQHFCVLVSILFGLLSLQVLLPGLNFSRAISSDTVAEMALPIPSISAWCVCYTISMLSMTVSCGLEEVAEKNPATQHA